MSSGVDGVRGGGGVRGPRGVGGASSSRVPAAGAGGVGQTGAIVPIAPADSISGTENRKPLAGSGVSVDALVATSDRLETRAAVTRGAMSMGLEQARTALLQELPVDALAALDDVWSGARHTEEGWYLRAGALAVLGLSGEGDRVAEEGLEAKPASLALRFIQALSRSMNGDWTGARRVLQEALDAAPNEPILKLQYAVNQARQGHRSQAEELIGHVRQQFPGHPAVEWARQMVRAATASRTRDNARHTVRIPSGEYAIVAEHNEPAASLPAQDKVRAEATNENASSETSTRLNGAERSSDLWTGNLRSSFADLGNRLGSFKSGQGNVSNRNISDESNSVDGAQVESLPTAIADAIREFLKMHSVGGVLFGASSSEQTHSARTLLSWLLQGESLSSIGLAAGLPAEEFGLAEPGGSTGFTSNASVPASLQQLLRAVRSGDYGAAERQWRNSQSVVPAAMRPLVQSLIEGMREAAERAIGNSQTAREPRLADFLRPGMRSGREVGIIQPVRFGLALLQEGGSIVEHGQMRSALAPKNSRQVATPSALEIRAEPGVLANASGLGGGVVAPAGVDQPGAGWAIAAAVSAPSGGSPETGAGYGNRNRPREGEGEADREGPLRLMAVLCLVFALVAGLLQYSAVAVAFGAGAAWLALRSSGRRNVSG